MITKTSLLKSTIPDRVDDVDKNNLTWKKWLLHVILIFLISRILILAIIWLSAEILPQKNIENLPLKIDAYKTSAIFITADSGDWIQSLIENGYAKKKFSVETQENWGYFPLWPILVKGLSVFTDHQLILEFIMTNLFFLISLITIFKFCKNYLSIETGYYTCIFLSIMPFNYVFMGLNPMSLCLMLSILALDYGFQKKWLKAGIVCFFASLGFVQGILLSIPITWLYMKDKKWKIKNVKWNIFSLSLGPIGLLSFMLYLKNITGNPFAFADIQLAWGNYGKWPLYNIIEFIKNPAIIDHYGWSLGIYDFLITVLALILTVWMCINCYLKKFE